MKACHPDQPYTCQLNIIHQSKLSCLVCMQCIISFPIVWYTTVFFIAVGVVQSMSLRDILIFIIRILYTSKSASTELATLRTWGTCSTLSTPTELNHLAATALAPQCPLCQLGHSAIPMQDHYTLARLCCEHWCIKICTIYNAKSTWDHASSLINHRYKNDYACFSILIDNEKEVCVGSDPHFAIRLPGGSLLCYTLSFTVPSSTLPSHKI